jgi:hypothetical protein
MHSTGHGVGVALLAVFSLLATIDGVWLHLWKLRLHSRPESWWEHVWHTARSVLAVPIVFALFATVSGGALLWAGVAAVAVDQLFESLDVASERDARRGLGGLSRFEYGLHLVLTTLRAAGVTAVLLSRPPEAWALDAPLVVSSLPEAWWAFIPFQVGVGAALVAGLHVVLATRHCPLTRCARA